MLWLGGLVLAFAGLFIWMELGCMIPRSGGEKVYLEAAYKHPKLLATTVFAFQIIILGFTGAYSDLFLANLLLTIVASGCIIFASYIIIAAGHEATEWQERGIAIAVISVVTLLHTFLPKLGVRGMNAIGMIKIGVLLFIVVTGWVILGGHVKSIPEPRASFQNAFAGSSGSSYEYATAMFKVLNSYAGCVNFQTF